MKILTSEQIYRADLATIENKQISSQELMEFAATQCYQWIDNYLKKGNKAIYVICGIGNNGGDGLVISRLLIKAHYQVNTFIVNFSKKRSKDFEANYDLLRKTNAAIFEINQLEDFPMIRGDEFIVDAIFGTGLKRPLKGWLKELVWHINKANARVISIDLPSGLLADSKVEDVDSVIISSEVLTFQQPKLAFLLPDNQKYIKNWHLIHIGLDQEFIETLDSNFSTIEFNFIKSIYRKRAKFSHKGTFGHSLIVGGSIGKIGAVTLATKAALKIGSGLVTAYVPKCGYQIIQISNPEVMVEVDAQDQLEFFNYKSKPNVVGIGIGMGISDKTCLGFRNFLTNNKLPLVIDADGLNILSMQKKLLKLIPENSVLTPHPKEFERLVGPWANDYDKLNKLIAFSLKYHCIVVLKGAYTAVAHQGNIYFNTNGNPGLATAGSGDVLTGIITGLMAQNYLPLEATIMGVFVHGRSADIAIENNESMETLSATSCIQNFHKVFKELN